MKLSTAAAHVWSHETATTAIPPPSNDEQEASNDILDDENNNNGEIYIVTVDSRQEDSPSNMKCFQENSCNAEFFRDHILDDPRMICVESQVAKMCGLDLKVYFHYDPNRPHPPASNIHHTNAAATLLLFHPHSRKYHHVIHGKAYVLWNDGHTALSKRQVWGLVELIREARALYDEVPMEEAQQQLLTWCSNYQQETWVPHGIYEDRKTHAQHCHQRHHHDDDHRSPGKTDNEVVDQVAQVCLEEKLRTEIGRGKELLTQDSGVTDAATCHHGACHGHHDVTPDHDEYIEIQLQEHHHHHHVSHKKRDPSGDSPRHSHAALDPNFQCYSLPVL